MPNVKQTLDERQVNYGYFRDNANTIQLLKSILRTSEEWESLFLYQKEALEQICTKIGRIVSGRKGKSYVDSWLDIAGYATLVAENIKAEDDKPSV